MKDSVGAFGEAKKKSVSKQQTKGCRTRVVSSRQRREDGRMVYGVSWEVTLKRQAWTKLRV